MSNPALVIARQELRASRSNRLSVLLLAIFIGMVLVSGFIGWATHRTVTQVYEESLRQAMTSAPNPFFEQQPLELIKNSVIYVILIGALSAIVLGVQSSLLDRKAGVIDLIFSRPLTMRQYVIGKLLGLQTITGAILLVAAFTNWAAIFLIRGEVLTLPDTVSLAKFFFLAWLFLLPFSVFGFISGCICKRETSSLLMPILVWVFLAFVLPQLGTAEHPVSLLNPVRAQTVSQGPFFRLIHTIIEPFSVTDRFKDASAVLLHLDVAGSSPVFDWLVLAAVAAISCAAAMVSIRLASLRKPLYE